MNSVVMSAVKKSVKFVETLYIANMPGDISNQLS